MAFEARCACQRVSIVLANDPIRCFVCHCDYCQRTTGSVGIAAAIFNNADVVAMEGEVLELDPELPKWPGARRYHCAKCGSAVHWVNPDAFPGMRLVSLGCFDDPSAWGLARTVQNQYRPEWCPQLVSPESFDEYPG